VLGLVFIIIGLPRRRNYQSSTRPAFVNRLHDSSAVLAASAIALTVAGTFSPPSNRANFRGAWMQAAIRKSRFRLNLVLIHTYTFGMNVKPYEAVRVNDDGSSSRYREA
jgi:hypothetical protein